MPNDAVTINAVCAELNSLLLRAKIEKIYQPENDELTFFIKNNGKSYNLVISANAIYPRIHLTSQKKQNPLVATPFCMLLRKHLNNGIINDISIINGDRIVKLSINARNEMGDITSFYLIIEVMGRYSNIILTNDNFTILDAIKRIHFDQNPSRPILANLKYSYPEQNKINATDTNQLAEFFKDNREYSDSYILHNISGLSKETAKEIVFRDKFSPNKIIDLFFNINQTVDYKPCIRYDKNGLIKDFYFTEYLSQKGFYVYFDTINECIDEFYSKKDTEIRKKADTSEIKKLLKRLKNKIDRRIDDNTKKLVECDNAEKYKQCGELILSNMYQMNKGQSVLECINFYTNNNEKIPLDTLKTPNQNAQNYFKKYHKLKRAKEISQQMLKTLKEQQDYLKSIEISITNSQTKQEYKEIFEELQQLGNLKKPTNVKKVKKQKPSSPLHLNIDGYDVYVGKNNMQNNTVTFEIGSSNDLWLHTKNFHGAHTIIKGNNIPNSVIEKAAQVTSYYSEGRDASKMEVDYTLRKNVKRHKNGMVGMVLYVNYKTILVQPTEKV